MPRQPNHTLAITAALFTAVLAVAPASAKDHHPSTHGGSQGHGYGAGYGPGPVYYPPMMGAPWPTTVMVQPMNGQNAYPQGYQGHQPQTDPRWDEMERRCRKVYGDKGIGGALIGGAVGGIVGHRIAGGNRILGTVAGAAVGAIAGGAIDKAEDSDLRRECDDYARSVQQHATGAAGYGVSGYAPYGYMMVPVVNVNQKPCVETTVVTERWVDEPVRRRSIPRRAPTKRVKEKRVYTG